MEGTQSILDYGNIGSGLSEEPTGLLGPFARNPETTCKSQSSGHFCTVSRVRTKTEERLQGAEWPNMRDTRPTEGTLRKRRLTREVSQETRPVEAEPRVSENHPVPLAPRSARAG